MIEEGQYYNRNILYVDHMRLQHEGVIVGDDGEYAYVQSTVEGVRPSAQGWHFRVKLAIVPGLLTD